jgi:hypothetical protein
MGTLDTQAQRLAAENGYSRWRVLDAHTGAWLTTTITGGGQILVGALHAFGGVSQRWSYTTVFDALAAWDDWVLTGCADEPRGWVRHQPSDRRRKYDSAGRCTAEWTAP